MVKVTVEYLGNLRCKVTHGPSGVAIETDAPGDNQGKGELFSPTDLVGAALGTCIETVVGILARRKGWNVDGMKVEVVKDMSQTGPRRIASLRSDVWMPLSLAPADREAVERAAHTCPVHHSLHPDIDAAITFLWP